MPRRLVPGRIPDPRKAHGAWIYLFAAVGAGAWLGPGDGVLRALCAGTAVVGAFVVVGGLAVGWKRGARLVLLGVSLAAGCALAALALGAPADHLVYSLAAFAPVIGAALFAERRGFLAPAALGCGVTALALAAPAAARAGGATHAQSLSLLAALLPFFVWRTLRIAARLDEEESGWDRERLRRTGLLEAAWTALWTLGASALVGGLA